MSKIINNTKNLIKKIIKNYRLNKLNNEYQNVIREMTILKLDAYSIRTQINQITGGEKS